MKNPFVRLQAYIKMSTIYTGPYELQYIVEQGGCYCASCGALVPPAPAPPAWTQTLADEHSPSGIIWRTPGNSLYAPCSINSCKIKKCVGLHGGNTEAKCQTLAADDCKWDVSKVRQVVKVMGWNNEKMQAMPLNTPKSRKVMFKKMKANTTTVPRGAPDEYVFDEKVPVWSGYEGAQIGRDSGLKQVYRLQNIIDKGPNAAVAGDYNTYRLWWTKSGPGGHVYLKVGSDDFVTAAQNGQWLGPKAAPGVATPNNPPRQFLAFVPITDPVT